MRPKLARRSNADETEFVNDGTGIGEAVSDEAESVSDGIGIRSHFSRRLLDWRGTLPRNKPPRLKENYQRLFASFKKQDHADQDICWRGSDSPDWFSCSGESAVAWMERHINLKVEGQLYPLHSLPRDPDPLTGRSYWSMWMEQREFLKQAFETDAHGTLMHNTVILCLQRGEGKSLVTVLGTLYRFFIWPDQKGFYSAFSKDQSQFINGETARNIIRDSPRLLSMIGGEKSIKNDEISLPKGVNDRQVSYIRTISSERGIYSNLSFFTCSEFHLQRSPFKFFVQLYQSRRNTRNAQAWIDSTASTKDHMLYQWYQRSQTAGGLPGMLFVYRCSQYGRQGDYLNPRMSDRQIEHYRETTPNDFAPYLLNLWGGEGGSFLSSHLIAALDCIGIGGKRDDLAVIRALKRREELNLSILELQRGGNEHFDQIIELDGLEAKFTRLSDLFHLNDPNDIPTAEQMEKIAAFYDSDYTVAVGIDIADTIFGPDEVRKKSQARSIVALVSRLNPGSRSAPFDSPIHRAPQWVYIVPACYSTNIHQPGEVKILLDQINEQLPLAKVTIEKHDVGDIPQWCKTHKIPVEVIDPKQHNKTEGFGMFHKLFVSGTIKAPLLPLKGSRGVDDIFREELSYFSSAKTSNKEYSFASTEKSSRKPGAVQDDSVYAVMWGIFGLQKLSSDEGEGLSIGQGIDPVSLFSVKINNRDDSKYDVDGFENRWRQKPDLLGDYS